MSSKSKEDSRLESEIERGREESDWKRVIELAKQRRAKYSERDVLASFLLGEGLLEIYLEEHAPVEENCATARLKLAEAKTLLQEASGEPGIALDAQLLLAKVHYAEGNYKEALGLYAQAGLENLSEKRLPLRSLRMIAEAYAIRALCTEAMPPGSSAGKYRNSERQEQIISWYEKAGDLALLYVQEAAAAAAEANKPSTTASTTSSQPSDSSSSSSNRATALGMILEKAVQRGPIVLLASGHYQRAVGRYRALLTAVEPPGSGSGGPQRQLRIALLNSFAEVLIRGDCPASYRPPQGTLERPTAKVTTGHCTPWMPKRYKNPNMFVPNMYYEEVILTLLIAEAMAVKEAVLSQSPEHADARQAAFKAACSVYDLLILVLSRWKEFGVLFESLERALKFCFDEPYPWWQFSLCLVNVGGPKTGRALKAMDEVIRLQPKRPLPCLMAARVCLEQLMLHSEGLDRAEKAIEKAELDDDDEFYEERLCLRSRTYCMKGIACYVLWKKQLVPDKRRLVKADAEKAFTEAADIDPDDHLPRFYLALLAAQARKLNEAMKLVRSALARRNGHQPSLHLLALILSARKDYNESLSLTEATIKEYPTALPLLYLKATLEEQVRGGEIALLTAKEMLSRWRAVFEEQQQAAMETAGQNSVSPQFNHEDSGLDSLSYSGDTLDKDNASISGSVAVVSQVEVALSEVASSLSSYQPKPGPQGIWMMQVQVWLLTAELYIRLNQLDSAMSCVMEASLIMPLSHATLCTRGLVHQARGELQDAKQCFLNAIAMNPHHVRSMEHLGLVYLGLGSFRLAEQVLREALILDPMDHLVWSALGQVLDRVGEHEAAADCLASALDLESSAPIVPFSSIPLCFE